MRVKVCGITQEEQMIMLPEVGAAFAGLIFYPKSNLRNVLCGLKTATFAPKTIKFLRSIKCFFQPFKKMAIIGLET